jgi:hypothetical protein
VICAAGGLEGEIRNGESSVGFIELKTTRYRTVGGIGIGSTVRALRAAYPDLNFTAEGSPRYVLGSICPSRVAEVTTSFAVTGIADTAKVTEIWIDRNSGGACG